MAVAMFVHLAAVGVRAARRHVLERGIGLQCGCEGYAPRAPRSGAGRCPRHPRQGLAPGPQKNVDGGAASRGHASVAKSTHRLYECRRQVRGSGGGTYPDSSRHALHRVRHVSRPVEACAALCTAHI